MFALLDPRLPAVIFIRVRIEEHGFPSGEADAMRAVANAGGVLAITAVGVLDALLAAVELRRWHAPCGYLAGQWRRIISGAVMS